jgi:hypothetical protein
MRQWQRKLAFVLAVLGGKARAAALSACRILMAGSADRYQPEAHYMRGPGPKWRAKNAQATNTR